MNPSSSSDEKAPHRQLSPDEAITVWSQVIDQLVPEYAPAATHLGLHRRFLVLRRSWVLSLALRGANGIFTSGVISVGRDGDWHWTNRPLGPALAEILRGMSHQELVLKTRGEFVERLAGT